jgi:hypothetical protein
MATVSLLDLLAPQAAVAPAPPVVGGTWALNPRPDLADDADLWRRLLAAAALNDDPDIYGVLHGVRCCGARLVKSGAGYRITPPAAEDGPLSYHLPDPETGEIGSWETDRREWLLPRRAVLTTLLRQLRAEASE